MSLLFRAALVVLMRERCCELLKALSSSRVECCNIWFFYVLLLRRSRSLGPGERGERCDGSSRFLSPGKTPLDFGGSFS